MGTTLKTMQSRNYLWDNIKTFLIISVVVGHFLGTYPVNSDFTEYLYYLIYGYHMPAFLFVSGYWSKSFCKESKIRVEKVGYLIGYYLIFQLIFFIEIWLLDPRKEFSLFVPNIGLWYLFAIIAYYLMIPIIEKIPAYISLPIFIFLGLTIGAEPEAGKFLASGRIFTFAPFFFSGYYMPEKLINRIRNLKYRILLGVATAIVSVSIWCVVLYLWKKDMFPVIKFYNKFYYETIGFSDVQGVLYRLGSWLISGLMIFAILLLFSEKKNRFSYVGQRSLQIYIIHLLLVIVFDKSKLLSSITIDSVWKGALLVVVAIACTFVLAIKPLSVPFEWIQKLVDKVITNAKTERK